MLGTTIKGTWCTFRQINNMIYLLEYVLIYFEIYTSKTLLYADFKNCKLYRTLIIYAKPMRGTSA